ncbi:hypothetical protein Poly30_08790 [Planctomycetes bacterium Poly30]|uniref:Uncharacterized protein n=1 Tax=Saltatorellus ferox TaxID=2528018 RepID=A0A518EMS0_9BACT|nr:hypothetical protein Poly30_08790 [Planctomycetes bacterium Poly30]
MKPLHASLWTLGLLVGLAAVGSFGLRTTAPRAVTQAAQRAAPLPLTDLFRVNVEGVEHRLDSPSAAERMAALSGGGHLMQMTSRQHGNTLLETIHEGVDPRGSWTLIAGDGRRKLHLAMEFDGEGGVRQSMALGDQGSVSSGTYALRGSAFTLEFEGVEISIPRVEK